LNRSTVGVLVSELADAGLVTEAAGLPGQVGRPSLRVAPVRNSAVVIAFDLKVERTIVALVGLGGGEIWRREQRHKRGDYTPEQAVRHVMSLIKQSLRRAPEGAAWVGVGIGVPGVVDHADGLVRLAPNLGWSDVPLGALLRAALESEYGFVPHLSVSNDADLGALAEHVRGQGAVKRNLIYLSGEVGIGGGIIIDGRPMLGAGGFGGEVGHMVVNPVGTECRCGARGCWETEIGLDALVRAAGITDPEAGVADVLAAASAGSRTARGAIDKAGEWLGVGLANLVNLFNPEVIVLGGHLRLLYPLVSSTVLRQVHHALPAAREQARVEVPALKADSTLLGAAEAAFEGLLADPMAVIADSVHATAS
jgi:predicted NBD/HSP70 family sugar kinase